MGKDLMLTEYVCVVAGLQSISMTTEKALAGEMKSALEGDARRTNQVGVLWNSQQLYIILLRPLNHSGAFRLSV